MSVTLKDSHIQFTQYLESRKRARATIVAYGKDIEQVISFLGNMGKKSIDEISRDELDAFLKKLASDSYTPKSISRKINSIKTFFRFLKATGIITSDPAIEIEHPKYEVKPPRILSKIEYRALRDACRGDVRIYAIVELFLQTGVRIGELANLTVEDQKALNFMLPPKKVMQNGMSPSIKLLKTRLSTIWEYGHPQLTGKAKHFLLPKPAGRSSSETFELP